MHLRNIPVLASLAFAATTSLIALGCGLDAGGQGEPVAAGEPSHASDPAGASDIGGMGNLPGLSVDPRPSEDAGVDATTDAEADARTDADAKPPPKGGKDDGPGGPGPDKADQ
jgi:hypothetical protein